MDKRLPNIYKGENYSHVNNNKKVFYSNKELDIRRTEDDEIISDEYILNIPVKIETYDSIITTKIVSKVHDHIMTSDNKIIKLRDIKSIKKVK